MDSLFIYTAQRSLIAGHTATNTYSLEIALMEETQAKRKVEKSVVRSLGGNTETLRDRADMEWTLSFEPVQGNKLAALREFLDSTESGETFQAYLYGTEAAPLSLIRTDDGYGITPFQRIGSVDGDWYRISGITAIEVTA